VIHGWGRAAHGGVMSCHPIIDHTTLIESTTSHARAIDTKRTDRELTHEQRQHG